jgi:hypothetical protein
MHITYTKHSTLRMGGRGISKEAVLKVLELGEIMYQDNRVVRYMNDKLASRHKRLDLRGIAVILDKEGRSVISVLRTFDRKKLRTQGMKKKKRERLSRSQLAYHREVISSAF